jgi:hypothetical protein
VAIAPDKLEHLETSIAKAQEVLDHVHRLVTALDAAQQRVERTARVLRQATIGLVVGNALLGGPGSTPSRSLHGRPPMRDGSAPRRRYTAIRITAPAVMAR